MPVAIESLQALIHGVSTEIDQQKQDLRRLEQSKSTLQRQLNDIRDPMARLPLEISSDIFLYCRPAQPRGASPPPALTAPMCLLAVCNAWSEIALATPKLWATIPTECLSVELLRIWLSRARNHPLSVHFRGALDDDEVFDALESHVEQLRHLQIYDDPQRRLSGDPKSLGPPLGCFARLETLTLGGFADRPEDPFNSGWIPRILGLLALTPDLLECTFDNVDCSFVQNGLPTTHVLLRSLTCLKFGTTTDVRGLRSQDHILQFLTLPALQTLFLSYTTISSEDFRLFLNRSLPPLQRLVIGDQCRKYSFNRLSEWLRIIPSLVHLEMYARVDLADQLFAALAETPSDLLPHLQTLHITVAGGQSAYQTLLAALTNRRDTLARFDLCIVNSHTQFPVHVRRVPTTR